MSKYNEDDNFDINYNEHVPNNDGSLEQRKSKLYYGDVYQYKKQNETPEIKADPVLGIFIILGCLIWFSMTFAIGSFRHNLNCDYNKCSYQQYNLFGKQLYSVNFEKNDITSLKQLREKKYRHSNRHRRNLSHNNYYYVYVYMVEISHNQSFKVPHNIFNKLQKYKNNQINKISNYTYYENAFGIIAAYICLFLCLFGCIYEKSKKAKQDRYKKKLY